MRVPLSWLAEYTRIEPGTTAEDVHAALVKVGLEEEDLHRFEITGPLVVGRVLDFVEEPQSNGKTIRWCQVDVGVSTSSTPGLPADPVSARVEPVDTAPARVEPVDTAPARVEPVETPARDTRGIVCGADNFVAGDLVVVALPGAVLPGPFPISARRTYGHVSDGMIVSERELGLSDDHDGILRLATRGIDAEPGTDAIALLGLDDAAVEVNVTPDRGYAFSIRGVAREYSHSTGAVFSDPADVPVAVPDGAFPVIVDDEAPIRGRVGCDVFVTRVVRGIDATRPTPAAMVARLKLAGIRSISLAVDVTNYVMLELGQPIHGYDLSKLSGGITVRRARAGETLETLDGSVRSLHVEDLLIADESGPIGLAGVMGGASTEISATTTDVLIEAAHFEPVSIARTARRHKLPSEASRRFERGVDPAVPQAAAQRVAELLVSLGGGTIDTLGSVYDEAPPLEHIRYVPGQTAAYTGIEVEPTVERGVLVTIGAAIEDAGDGWSVVPPSWRPDLTEPVDLVEEIARLVGYDRIPSLLPGAPAGRGFTRAQVVRRRVAQSLAAAGAVEVLDYPFLSSAQVETWEPGAPAVKLQNALDASTALLRRTLLPGLIGAAQRNLSRGFPDLALFEVGTVFRPQPGVEYGTAAVPVGARRPSPELLASLNAGIPPQTWRVAALLLGDVVAKQPGSPARQAGIADALDLVRIVGLAAGAELSVRQATHPALHSGRAAEILLGDTLVGIAGEVHPSLTQQEKLPRVVAVMELELDTILALTGGEVIAEPLSTFPAATQDVSVTVDVSVPAAAVREALVAGAGDLLESVRLVDDYRGSGIAADAKSLTFALRFRAADRTLTAAEATAAKLAGVAVAAERFGAVIRE